MSERIEILSKKLIQLIKKHNVDGLNNFLSSNDFTKLLDTEKVSILIAPNLVSEKSPIQQAILMSSTVDLIETILNAKSLGTLDADAKYRILTEKFKNEKTLLEVALEKSYLYLRSILDNELINSLNLDKKFLILQTTFKDNKFFFESLASKSIEHITTVLESSFFKQFTNAQQVMALTSSSLRGPPPFFVAANQNSSKYLAAFINCDVFTDLSQDDQINILKQTEVNNGRTILHHVALKSSGYSEVIFNSGVFDNLKEEQIYSLLILPDRNNIISFQSTIVSSHKNNDPNIIINYLKSKLFNKLPDDQKEGILQLNTGKYLDLFIKLGKYDKSISPFFSSLDFSLARDYIEVIKQYKQVDALENLAKIALYPDHLDVVDSKNYSVLYYLCSKGFNTTLIKQYKSKGMQLITPPKYDLKIYQKHFLFIAEESNKTVLIITGSQNAGNIEIGLESILHQKKFNVISINTNCDDKFLEEDIYSIIKSYSKKYNIYFLIINIHGGDHYVTDVALDVTKNNDVAITSERFFTKIVESIGKNDPLDILLTSCNGQLATNVIQHVLPKNSRFITLGENTGKDKIHTKVQDLQNVATVLDLADSKSIETRSINLDRILTDYLMHMVGTGSPTYTIIGDSTFMLKKLNSPSLCISSLKTDKIDTLSSKLCDLNDHICSDFVRKTINGFVETKNVDIGSITYLSNLTIQDGSFKLGHILAIKFNYALYCDQLWNEEFDSNKKEVIENIEFCCAYEDHFCINEYTFFDKIVEWLWH